MSIELFFDLASETALRALWNTLAEQDICSVQSISGARPHLSLSVFESLPEARLHELLRRVAHDFAVMPFQFTALGHFPRSGVTFLAPKPTLALLQIQERVHEELVRQKATIWEHYTPARWFPHCTLTMQAAPALLERIAQLADESSALAPATAASKQLATLGLVRIQIQPVTQLAEYALRHSQ